MKLNSDVIFNAYCKGTFPMAQGKDDPNIFWVSPEYRGIIPLTYFHISKSLRNLILKQKYQIKIKQYMCGNYINNFTGDTVRCIT